MSVRSVRTVNVRMGLWHRSNAHRRAIKMASQSPLIPAERIERSILLIRGHKVMLDSDLAALYGVETKQLVRAVKRDVCEIPAADFAYQLTRKEFTALKCQFGTSKSTSDPRGGRRTPPWVLTEQGVAMLSSVLHSDRAVAVNIEIMRTFRPVETNAAVARRPWAAAGRIGTEVRQTIFGRVRRDPPTDDPAQPRAARKSAITRSCKVLGNLLSLCLRRADEQGAGSRRGS